MNDVHTAARLTPRQCRLYRDLVAHLVTHQRLPTTRELCASHGRCSEADLAALANAGLLDRGQCRTHRLRLCGVRLSVEALVVPRTAAGRLAKRLMEGER